MPDQPQKNKQTFNKGDIALEAGEYVCVPCGYHKVYQPGEKFTECISCFSGTAEGHEDFAEGLEMWEKVECQPGNQTEEKKT